MRTMRRLIRYLFVAVPLMLLYTMCFLHQPGLLVHRDPITEGQYITDYKTSKPMLDVSSEFPIRMIVQKLKRKSLSLGPSGLAGVASSVPLNQLLNIKNFTFLMNASHSCQSEPYFLAFVHSAPRNFAKRQVIRQTWASPNITRRLNIRVVFIIGLSNDSAIENHVREEGENHRDVVQGNFIDSYRNLTYKHLVGYRWTMMFCNTTRFVMKADDDAFVDVFKIVSSLKSMFDVRGDRRPASVLACSLFPDGTATKRSGKWALSVSEYSAGKYPSYCSGIGYFTTPDVIFKLFAAAHEPDVHPIWIDDLFVTGILPARIRQSHQELNINFTYDHRKLRKWLQEKEERTNPYLVGDIGEASDWSELMEQLWEKTVRVSR